MPRIGAMLALWAALCPPVDGQQPDFLQKGPPKWREYTDRAKQLQGRFVTIVTSPAPKSELTFDVRIKQNQTSSLLAKKTTGTITTKNKSTRKDKEEVFGANAKYSFHLIRQNDGWLLASWDTNRLAKFSPGEHSVERMVAIHVLGHMSLIDEPLLDVVNHPTFAIRNTQHIEQGRRVKVNFSYTSKWHGMDLNKPGWMILDPRQWWCLRELNIAHLNGIVETEYEVENSPAGLPNLKSRRTYFHTPDHFEQHIVETCDIYEDANVPDSEFRLSAFGLPEPEGIVWPRETNWWLWFGLLAGAIALIALGRFLWRRQRSKQLAASANGRSGFTLVELLVVIAIIAVLVALLLPAVQAVRQTAIRAECLNNLKQIGLAAHQYHDSRKALPPGMRYQNFQDPHLMSSWLTELLPYLDQQNLWSLTEAAYKQQFLPFKDPPHVGLGTVIGLFVCPADGRAFSLQLAKKQNIRVAFTCYLGVSGRDLTTEDGVLYRDSRIRLTDISDGTSNTLLAGERPPSADFQFGWWYAGEGQKATGSCDMILGVEEQNVLPITVGSCGPGTYRYGPGRVHNQCDMFHFWSLHAGGGHFLMADGSVHFLAYSAAPILPALASRGGRESASIVD